MGALPGAHLRSVLFVIGAIFGSLLAFQYVKRPEKNPLLVGLRAAKKNLVPGLILQLAMIALVFAYYFAPSTHDAFAILAEVKQRGGFAFSIAASAIAGGLLPEIFAVLFFQRGKFTRANLDNVVFGIVLWGFEGFTVDLFYRSQAVWFGSEVNVATVVKKVMVDQLLYTPLFAAPFSMAAYEWKNSGFSTRGMSRVLTPAFYKTKTFPAVIANWGVWIPLVTVIYSLPSLLQVPLFLIALTFWVLIFTFIANSHTADAGSVPANAPVVL
jgi:hypothetical protein